MADILEQPLISVPRIKMLLRRFTYKPNFSFTVYQGRPIPGWGVQEEGVQLAVAFYAEDSTSRFRAWDLRDDPYWAEEHAYYDPYRRSIPSARPMAFTPRLAVTSVSGTFMVPPHISCEEEFWDWLREVPITFIEEHERDEWFKVDGRPPYDPHNPNQPMPNPHDWVWKRNERERVMNASKRMSAKSKNV